MVPAARAVPAEGDLRRLSDGALVAAAQLTRTTDVHGLASFLYLANWVPFSPVWARRFPDVARAGAVPRRRRRRPFASRPALEAAARHAVVPLGAEDAGPVVDDAEALRELAAGRRGGRAAADRRGDGRRRRAAVQGDEAAERSPAAGPTGRLRAVESRAGRPHRGARTGARGYRPQGVPFTAPAGRSGIVSWGADPPASVREFGASWRRWVTRKLAAYLCASDADDALGSGGVCPGEDLRRRCRSGVVGAEAAISGRRDLVAVIVADEPIADEPMTVIAGPLRLAPQVVIFPATELPARFRKLTADRDIVRRDEDRLTVDVEARGCRRRRRARAPPGAGPARRRGTGGERRRRTSTRTISSAVRTGRSRGCSRPGSSCPQPQPRPRPRRRRARSCRRASGSARSRSSGASRRSKAARSTRRPRRTAGRVAVKVGTDDEWFAARDSLAREAAVLRRLSGPQFCAPGGGRFDRRSTVPGRRVAGRGKARAVRRAPAGAVGGRRPRRPVGRGDLRHRGVRGTAPPGRRPRRRPPEERADRRRHGDDHRLRVLRRRRRRRARDGAPGRPARFLRAGVGGRAAGETTRAAGVVRERPVRRRSPRLSPADRARLPAGPRRQVGPRSATSSRATPLPFDVHGVRRWPAVERTLAKALSKDPADRFGSLDEMADALRDARAGVAGRRRRSAAARPPGRGRTSAATSGRPDRVRSAGAAVRVGQLRRGRDRVLLVSARDDPRPSRRTSSPLAAGSIRPTAPVTTRTRSRTPT